MTSPNQLKFLDAMGIPVWVSRDRYKEEILSENTQPITESSNPLDQLSAGKDPVENLLQSLNLQDKPKVESNVTSFENKPVVKDSIVQNVSPPSRAEDVSIPGQNELVRTDSHIVYATGNLQADWMIIGESPELNDDRNNQPFAGDAGVLLDNMIRAVGIDNPRNDSYLINVIKSSMDKASPESIEELNKILCNKINEVKPKMILIVGQLSAQNLLQTNEPLARLRAKQHKYSDTDTHVVVTYYPTHLLSKPIDKRKSWEDLKLAMRLVESIDSSN